MAMVETKAAAGNQEMRKYEDTAAVISRHCL